MSMSVGSFVTCEVVGLEFPEKEGNFEFEGVLPELQHSLELKDSTRDRVSHDELQTVLLCSRLSAECAFAFVDYRRGAASRAQLSTSTRLMIST